MFICNRVKLGKATNVRVLQLFRKERGLARRAEANGVGRSSAATAGIIVEPGEYVKCVAPITFGVCH
jgi:hypothetical protein